MPERTGGRILVDQLMMHELDTVFCVPGESYLAALDAFRDTPEIRVVVTRHEGGASFMAEAHGKLTGKPAVCFVTRGPGAANAAIGVHTARQDSTPMLLLVGLVRREHSGREAFQEIDVARMFGSLAKWADTVPAAEALPEYVARAVHAAVHGRPGPAVLGLPEDVLSEVADTPDAAPVRSHPQGPDSAVIGALASRLSEARRPLVLAGGGGWTAATSEHLARFAASWDLPVVSAFRRADCLDNRDPRYVGEAGLAINPSLAGRIKNADLVLVVGPRLGEATTSGYTLLAPPRPAQTLVHVHPDPDELGRVYEADLPVVAHPEPFLAAAVTIEPPTEEVPWRQWTRQARAAYDAWTQPPGTDAPVDLARVITTMRDQLPDDAIITNGAGNFTRPLHRFFTYTRYPSELAPTGGAMGYGLPAAVAAKLAAPARPVVCLTGDGDFLMTGQELATAMQYEAAVIVVMVNNDAYGTIRTHQERAYPGREFATTLRNPDFVALARSYGAHAERVTQTGEFATAFDRALRAGRPALVEIRTSD